MKKENVIKLLLISALLTPITACVQSKTISKEDIAVAEYVCRKTGEELYEISAGGTEGMEFRCGGIEGKWLDIEASIILHGTACILENP